MALSDTVALRYGKAFFELAREKDAVEPRRRALARTVELLGHEQARALLGNPKVSIADRSQIVQRLLEGIDPSVRNLARLLVERGRLEALPKVLEVYERLGDEASGRVRAEVRTAIELSAARQRAIGEELGRRLKTDVQTTVVHDPDIIGGLVIRIGDRAIDGSVRARLQQLQASLA